MDVSLVKLGIYSQPCVGGTCQVPGMEPGWGTPMNKLDMALLSRSSQSSKKINRKREL